LGGVADWLLPQARGGDVRDELEQMACELEAAEKRLQSWRAAPARVDGAGSARAEALGQFSMVAGPLVRGSAGLDLNDDIDPASIITMAALLARRAANQSPGRRSRRTPNRSSWQAIQNIVRQLWSPPDDYSRQRAGEFKVSVDDKSEFFKLACVVWAAVLGDNSGSSPERAIKAFLKRQRQSTGQR